MTAGDSRRALDLLAATYAYLERIDRSAGVEPDDDWMVDAAHSVFAAHPTPTGAAAEVSPVRALDTVERVVVSLVDTFERSPEHVAALLGCAVATVENARRSGLALLAPYIAGSSVADVVRQGDVWFDDAMRAEVRATLGHGHADSTAAPLDGRSSPSFPEAPPRSRRSPETRSRRMMVGAGIAAAVVVVVVAIWVGSSGDDAEQRADLQVPSRSLPEATAAATPSTDATTGDSIVLDPSTGAVVASGSMETSPSTTTVEVPGEPQTGFIADPAPTELLPAGAFVDDGSSVPFRSWFEVWASADAAHTTGRWLAIHVGDSSWTSADQSNGDLQRIELGGHQALVETFADGVFSAAIELSDEVRVELESFGLSIDILDTLTASLSTDTAMQPSFGASSGAALAGLDLRISRASKHFDLRTEVASGIRNAQYSSSDGQQYVRIEARGQESDDLFATGLLTAAPADPALSARIVDVGGRRVLVGLFERDGSPFVQWHEGDDTVTIEGSVAIQEMMSIAATARVATPDEWSPKSSQIDAPAGIVQGPPQTMMGVGSAITKAGGSWSAALSSSGPDASGDLPASIGQPNGSETYTALIRDPDHPVVEFLDPGATVLVGWFTDPGAATALRVTLSGEAPVDVPLVQLGQTTDFGAMYAFSQTVDFTIALVDAGGNIVRDLAR